MQHRLIYLSNVVVLSLFAFVAHAGAQIIPDGSLGAENSRVVPNQEINGVESDRIDGGAIRGANLFHSFSEFNIREGRGAYFSNPDGITNILTRVTGTNRSNILGTLGVLGNANLFFLNPNGIIFGANAKLDLRGSFLATTADTFVFDSGWEFSASNPQTPILTINIPIGLQFRNNPGSIINRSTATVENLPPLPLRIINNSGLAVQPGQTLAFVGGDIQIDGGILTANSGQILLVSVASPGFVGFDPTGLIQTLNYENIQNFGNIQISDGAINTSGLAGGRLEIRGKDVNISRSQIAAQTLGNENGRGIEIRADAVRIAGGKEISTFTFGSGMGGSIAINATELVELSGIGVESFREFLAQIIMNGIITFFDPNLLLVTGSSTGSGGDITINTRRLLLRDGASIGSATFGAGRGGNITLRANEIDIAGSGINSGTLFGSTGNGGNIDIEARQLTVRDASVVSAVTLSQGSSGNISIRASESVQVLRTPDTPLQTAIGTTAARGTGKAGDITIDTRRLIASEGVSIDSGSGFMIAGRVISSMAGDGGNITIRASESVEVSGISAGIVAGEGQIPTSIGALTTTDKPGGEIRINTPRLIVRDGGVISTASLGAGNASNITIDAEEIEVIGSANGGQFISKIEASSGSALGIINPDATGKAGSLNINSNRLIIRDRATINVANLGSGDAGTINIFASAIALDTNSSINATTGSGGEGNINLEAKDIQLRRGSRITTDAGSSMGGNITINSDILLAFPAENSDITANAQTAKGGTVNINVDNIFGIAAISRDQIRNNLGLTDAELEALTVNPTFLLQSNDIAAISQAAGANLQGTVTFSTSGINPAQGLVELPQNIVDSATLIAANPCAEGQASEFVITGRGGLPANGGDRLIDDPVRVSWSELPAPQESRGTEKQGIRGELTDSSRERIVPAQGWEIDERGVVTLVAYNPGNSASVRHPNAQIICPPR